VSDQAVFFVRDDDVGELTDALRFFVDTFLERQIPVSYQIIPGQLTDACAQFLVDLRRAHPNLIEFGQHGLHHRMVVGDKVLKREFGPELDFQSQDGLIREGRAILAEKLGTETPVKVFTPPQHKYDRNTVRAAAEAGHQVFSAASYPDLTHQAAYLFGRAFGLSSYGHQGVSYHGRQRPEGRIREVSISIDVDDGKAVRWPAAELAQGLQGAAKRTQEIGLMFHHEIYGGADGAETLRAIVSVLDTLPKSALKKLGDMGGGQVAR
jgi:hypothetical protein